MNQKLVGAVDNAPVEASTEEGFLSLGAFIAALRDQGYEIAPTKDPDKPDPEAVEGDISELQELLRHPSHLHVEDIDRINSAIKRLQSENSALRQALRELQTRRGKSIAGRSANIAVVDEARKLTGEGCSKCDGHGHIWMGEDVKPCPECN